jgi:hypothetical protein
MDIRSSLRRNAGSSLALENRLAPESTGNRVTSQASGPKNEGSSGRYLELNDRILPLFDVQDYLVIGRSVPEPIAEGLIEFPSVNEPWKKDEEK